VITLGTTRLNTKNSAVRPQNVFSYYVRFSEQEAIISLCTALLIGGYNREGERLLRGTSWIFIYNSGYSESLKG
jgi:hypothetical protein